jgi:transcriptional regulator with XRE-family HTH domain
MNNDNEQRFRTTFGEVVRKHRRENKISQEVLGDNSQLHRTYISEIERGLKTVSLLSLFRISEALGIPAHTLIEEVENAINTER